jgi:hypothetical protein
MQTSGRGSGFHSPLQRERREVHWRKSIQDKLDKDDQFTINLCKTYGVIEEGEPDRRAPRKKSSGRKARTWTFGSGSPTALARDS